MTKREGYELMYVRLQKELNREIEEPASLTDRVLMIRINALLFEAKCETFSPVEISKAIKEMEE